MAASRNKPSDHFTRFTSATPHASTYQVVGASQPTSASAPTSYSNSSRRLPSSNGPPGETPAQKVARLRAAHRAAQEAASYSLADKIIANGRIVADKLHRGAAYSLMGLTVISVALASYSFVSLISHNRRQKRAWIERELQRLQDAQLAFLRGEATAEQLHILEQERAGEMVHIHAEEEKRKKKANSLWGKTKRSLYSIAGIEEQESMGELARKGEFAGIIDMVKEKRLQEQQQQPGHQRQGALTDREGAAVSGQSSQSSSIIGGVTGKVSQAISEHRQTGEKQLENQVSPPPGGMLDQIADNAATALASGIAGENGSGRTWFSWIRGGGGSKN